jgi:hypothetical protein
MKLFTARLGRGGNGRIDFPIVAKWPHWSNQAPIKQIDRFKTYENDRIREFH